jgi:hypothetical protein
MQTIAKALRIEPAFDDLKFARGMFERNGPYRTMAAYLPIWSIGENSFARVSAIG